MGLKGKEMVRWVPQARQAKLSASCLGITSYQLDKGHHPPWPTQPRLTSRKLKVTSSLLQKLSAKAGYMSSTSSRSARWILCRSQ